MARLRYNGLATGASGSTVGLSLGASLTSSATSVTFNAALTYQNGTAVPTIVSPDYIPLEILDANGRLSEIVYLTAYTAAATTGTITRGQEGTTGVAHSSGDKVVHGATVADIVDARDRRWRAGSSEVSVDEFNDDSLDVAWTRVDGTGAASGNCSWTEGADTLTGARLGTNTGNAANGLVRAIGTAPATGDAWVTCVTMFCPPTQYSKCGIVISDGTTFGAGKQVEAVLYKVSASSANSYMSLACTNWNETGATTAGGGDIATPGTPVFLRLVYKGSSQWRVDVSPNGVDWLLGSAMVTQSSFTPAYVGFFSADAGSGIKHIAAYEFLRRAAGVS